MSSKRQALVDAAMKMGNKSLQLGKGMSELYDKTEEFFYLPLSRIKIHKQVRKAVDVDSEKFKNLRLSIAEGGVIQPIIVVKNDQGDYDLVIGERRYTAAFLEGLQTIPCRLGKEINTREDIIEAQLIENLQREDLDPVDEANAYLEYFKERTGEGNVTLILNDLISMDRHPERAKEEFAATVAAIQNISGKSTSSLKNIFSLLRLPENVQIAIKTDKLNVSLGYILAGYTEHERFAENCDIALKEDLTQAELKKLFAEPRKSKPLGRPKSFNTIYKITKALRTDLETAGKSLKIKDLNQLRDEVVMLLDVIEAYKKNKA